MTDAGPSTYDFGPFRLDAAQRTLTRDGRHVQLTPKALDTLVALVGRAGQVVPKAELLTAVWPDAFVEESNLTQHIYTLRRVLGDQPNGAPYIETVPKRGYRFAGALRRSAAEAVSFEQLTFRRGAVLAARFSPDGGAILYAAAWEGGPLEIFAGCRGGEPHPVGITGASLLAVSGTEAALQLDHVFLRGYVSTGTLALAPLGGGEPRVVCEHVQEADYSPDGDALAVVREAAGRSRLEYPLGNPIFETGGWIANARVSPSGDLVAFIHHPVLGDDGGSVDVVDRALNHSSLSPEWVSVQGLAWSPTGDEVWFTASRDGGARALFAVSLAGDERDVSRMAGSLTLHDVSRDGRVLLTRDDTRVGIIARPPGQAERDVSWHDWSLARDLSDDGRLLLFTEAGASGGATYAAYVRRTDSSTAVRIGDGSALALSPDCRHALVKARATPARLMLLPIEPEGLATALASAALAYHPWASFFPDGARVLFAANPPGRGTHLYVQDLAGGAPRALGTPEGASLPAPRAISPDGRLVACLDPSRSPCVVEIETGRMCPIEGVESGDIPVRWALDGRSLFVRRRGDVPALVCRVDLATGASEPVARLMPSDPAGVHEILRVLLTPEADGYAYTYTRALSTLFVIRGLR
jgi:DNA-binding winged helix-turn-helix (wHTH) protein